MSLCTMVPSLEKIREFVHGLYFVLKMISNSHCKSRTVKPSLSTYKADQSGGRLWVAYKRLHSKFRYRKLSVPTYLYGLLFSSRFSFPAFLMCNLCPIPLTWDDHISRPTPCPSTSSKEEEKIMVMQKEKQPLL